MLATIWIGFSAIPNYTRNDGRRLVVASGQHPDSPLPWMAVLQAPRLRACYVLRGSIDKTRSEEYSCILPARDRSKINNAHPLQRSAVRVITQRKFRDSSLTPDVSDSPPCLLFAL